MSSLHCTVSSHDESLPDTGEERRGVGCVSWSWVSTEVGGLLSPRPAVADWRPGDQWQARLVLCGPIRGQAWLRMEHMFTFDTSPACSLHCDQGASVTAFVSCSH